MNKLRKTLLILFALLAFGQGAWAQKQYINQLMLIGDYEGVLIESNVQVYQEDGWTLVDYNLNNGTNSDQIIYLLYKTGMADDPDHTPITDFYIKSTSDKNDHPDMIEYNDRDYYRITSIVGSESFTNSYGDLNDGAGGKYIYLYYTTDDWDYPRGISEISFNSTSDGAICGNGGTEPQDLNEGAHGDYIYMHYKYAMTIDVIDVYDQWDFNPLNATCSDTLHFRIADLIANNEVITSSNIIVGNNNIAVIDLNGKYFGRLIQSGGGTDTGHVFKVIGNSTLIIIDSSTEGTGYIATGDADKGGAFYIDASSKLIINGGIIESCHADYGGAIYNLGTLTINGGTIQNCFATRGWGQGIIYNNGTLTINGGTIQNNTAYYGGAIYNVYGWTTTINGGVIQNNNAMENNGYYTDDGVGGGILNYGILYINGGTIQGNSCDREGGGIWMTDEGGLFMKGNPVIRDNKKGSNANNVYVPNEHKIIDVVGNFTEGACIGVTPQTYDNRITNNYCEGHNIGVDPAGIFFSDNGYFIKLNDDNEVVLDPNTSALMVSYINANGNEVYYSSCLPLSTSGVALNATLNSGWYILDTDIRFNIRINVDGNVNLILADDKSLTANAGIGIAGSTNSLTIYGQSKQTGQLTATGNEENAAIGSGKNTSAGTITINGGIVKTTGGNNGGAGIGGGPSTNGPITINGGHINATGGSNGGVGIGGGTTAINLNWTDASIATESIKASSYGGTVTLLKDFIDGTNVYSAGVVADNSALAWKTLVPKIVFNSDGNWNDATKWNIGKVPSSTDIVYVFAAATIPDAYVVQNQNITIGTGGSLTIKDGGQLIHSQDVIATLEKNITGYGFDPTVQIGWYTIASPVTTDYSIEDMTTGSYDLFYYNEPFHYWMNTKVFLNHFHVLENAKGYLYANSADKTLSFTGNMQGTDNTVTLPLSYLAEGDLKGFNLVGNPFTRNLTSSDIIKIGNQNLTAYYAAENDANFVAHYLDDDPIKPGQGFFVQAWEADQNLVINYKSRGEQAKSQSAYLRIEAGDEAFMDRAYLQIGDGNTLTKMNLMVNTPKVSVQYDGKEWAAATIKAPSGEIPVNFKAAKNGPHTISVNTKGLDLDYLHLIDNLTGANIDLLTTPSYSFSAKTTDYESRFKLVFDAPMDDASTNSATFAFLNNGEIVVNGEGMLQVIDMTGRIVLSGDAINRVSTSGMTPGMYVLRLINGKDVKVQKMVIE